MEYITADNYGTVAAHTAVLFEDELYSVDKGPSALRKFGILTGLAVLYVEPLEPELYIPNTARSQLLRRKGKGSVPFTIDDVAAEFRENMPLPIEKWQTELIEKSVGMNPEQMLEKLFEVHGHHLIPRPKAPFQAQIFEMPGAMLPAREEHETEQTAAPAEQEPAPEREQAEKRKLADDEARGVAHRADPSQPEQPAQQRAGFPKIQYVWVDHDGLEPGMFASFENHGRYVLTMNRQWPGIEAVLRLLGSEASKHGEAIKKAAQSHLELKLADAIYSVYEQREKRLITEEQFEAMLKPEALTAVAGQRYHMHQVLSRELKNIAA